MKKYIFSFFLFLFFALMSSKTEAQSLKSLEANNGFKKYKLGSKFNMGYGVKRKDEEGADRVVIDYSNEMIGDIPVKTIELYYLKDTLAKIIVRIPPNYYQKLIDGCITSFGQPTQDVSNNAKKSTDSTVSSINYTDDYIWKTKNFRLEYFYFYPKSGTGGYGNTSLQLNYVLNDYALRLKRAKIVANPAKNF